MSTFILPVQPFIGILFNIGKIEYFAPLSSPKLKHLKMKNTLDFFKIKNGELGAVNFNNMIPVMSQNYTLLDLNKIGSTGFEKKYINLLKQQRNWLNINYKSLKNKSQKLYDLYNSGMLNINIMNRCCNFKLLEEKCSEYNNLEVKS